MSVTGRIGFRRTWRGKVVLQVEEEVSAWWPSSKSRRCWRDATVVDLAQPQMRPLMDLRLGPPIVPRALATERLAILPRPVVDA